MCALRIPNGSGNVLLDNIESDSTPIIYTRRNRFLDEELDETKDVITTHRLSSSATTNGYTEDRTHHKISMLMSDGVVNMPNDECLSKTNHCNAINKKCGELGLANGIDISQNHDCDQVNQKINSNVMHKSSETNVMEKSANKTELYNDVGLPQDDNDAVNQTVVDHIHSGDGSNELEISSHPVEIGSGGDIQQKNQLMHQLRQKHQMSFVDETSLLRRQQLSRVAEWVQNNSYETIHSNTDSNYKQQSSKFNNNTNSENSSVDRNLKSLTMINCNNNNNSNSINNNSQLNRNKYDILSSSSATDTFSDVNMINNGTMGNDLEFAQKPIDYSYMNNNVKSQSTSTTPSNQTNVDLAQMEYNVKQFLLKQNEWSSPKSQHQQSQQLKPQPQPSSSVSVTLSMNQSLSPASSININGSSAKLHSRSITIDDSPSFSSPELHIRGAIDLNRPSSQPATFNPHRTETNL